MPVALTDDMKDKLDHALENGNPCLFAVVGPDGYPSMSYRGSLMVYDNDHLAYWDRTLHGAIASTKENPKVSALFRDPAARVMWRFYGDVVAHHADGAIRDAVMARTRQRELDADPERKGIAVMIRVNKVLERGAVLMERESEHPGRC
ncbi:MAG: pyridoxamine 5'-phosphate oxidase family protein [Dehalococcoidia bacterium]|nr:pyridoxamine 5'-phosphate oxidase family protein [Dehalococcoidia bacterium]